MELSKQVTSLEISQRLKELGVKQDSIFCWEDDSDAVYLISRREADREGKEWSESCPSAFTVAELGEMLPWLFHSGKQLVTNLYNCYIKTSPIDDVLNYTEHSEQADTEANARGKMLIYLLENNLITLK